MKQFVFEYVDLYGGKSIGAPYYDAWTDVLGKTSGPFSEEQLLRVNFSQSVLNRIPGLREGSTIRVSRLSSSTELFIRRLDSSEINKNLKIQELEQRLAEIRLQIRKCVPEDLLRAEADTQKELKKLKRN